MTPVKTHTTATAAAAAARLQLQEDNILQFKEARHHGKLDTVNGGLRTGDLQIQGCASRNNPDLTPE